MATKNARTVKTNAAVAEPTAAMKLAALFDAAKDKVVADVKRPAAESRTKQVAAVAGVAGVAIGLWELAGM